MNYKNEKDISRHIVNCDCQKCKKAKVAIKKLRDVIESGSMQVNGLWAQIAIGDAIEIFKEILDE